MIGKSVDEFIKMYRTDPMKARGYLGDVLGEGKESTGNYSEAIRRRMRKNKKKPKMTYGSYQQEQ